MAKLGGFLASGYTLTHSNPGWKPISFHIKGQCKPVSCLKYTLRTAKVSHIVILYKCHALYSKVEITKELTIQQITFIQVPK